MSTQDVNAQRDFIFRKDHDAIPVSDLEVSAEFYKNILGLKEIPNGGLPDHIRWFQLSDRTQLHIIESKETIQKKKGVHMAVSTDLLHAFMEHLRNNNVHFENWPGDAGTTNTRPDGIKQIYFQDPDGYWIEVNDNQL